jgi:hypothetical protein
MLPHNVVRLRVLQDGAPIDLSTVKLEWSFKGKTPLGALAADLDLGPGDVPTVSGMCADFGNECALGGDRLKEYDRDTIFYIAPTCDDLARNPRKPFAGGSTTIRVKASQGGRKLGKATTTIGFGRNGAVVLYARNQAGQFVDGVGRSPVTVSAIAEYAARLQQPAGVSTPPTSYQVTGDLGSVSLVGPCAGGYDACGVLEHSGERGTLLLTAAFEDGSALCDNIAVVIALCAPPSGEVIVSPSPRRAIYDPADSSQNVVDLTVRLRNTSQPGDGLPACNFYLRGNIISCSSMLRVGDFTETETHSFSLPHCSGTTDRSCSSDGDCRPPTCADCAEDERCLVRPYCSRTVARDCTRDEECAPPACPECQANEICVQMLSFPGGGTEIFLPPGESVTLVTGRAQLRNRFKATASLKDTWTVNVRIPALTFDKNLRYRIRGRPQ